MDCLSYTSFTLPDGHRRGFLLHRTSVLAYTGKMIYNHKKGVNKDTKNKNTDNKNGCFIYVLRGYCNRVLITVRTGKPPR